MVAGEGREACLARLYPDHASLIADPGFDAASQRLYAPFKAWLDAHAQAEILPSAQRGAAASADAAGAADA